MKTLLTMLALSVSVFGAEVEMIMVNGRPAVQNNSDKTLTTYVVAQRGAGLNQNMTFVGDPIPPHSVHVLGLAKTFRVENQGPILDSEGVQGYVLRATMHSDGKTTGDGPAVAHLKAAYRRSLGPVSIEPRGSREERPQFHKKYAPDVNPYPGTTGTPIFAYSGDEEFIGFVLEGTESPLVEGRAYCFNGPFVPYGYLIGGGVYQFNDGGCGILYTHSNGQQNFDSTGNPWELQQNIATDAVLAPIRTAIRQQFEGCDFGTNYEMPGAPAPSWATPGDPWVQILHDGACVDQAYVTGNSGN